MIALHPIEDAPEVVRLAVLQGECRVSDDAAVVLTTLLGSCIACCLHDPFAGAGGLNHFLLPGPPLAQDRHHDAPERYGLHAMETLVEGMLALGATRATMRARLFGGANLHPGMHAIGTDNARFARRFLRESGIALAAADVGGDHARRLEFQPASGRVRACLVVEAPADATERGLMLTGDRA